jgi:hypothetical protein
MYGLILRVIWCLNLVLLWLEENSIGVAVVVCMLGVGVILWGMSHLAARGP